MKPPGTSTINPHDSSRQLAGTATSKARSSHSTVESPTPNGWPQTAKSSTGTIVVLVAGSTGDTPTPLQSSRGLAEHLEEGVLLIVEANQHGAYFVDPDNLCVMQTVDGYLADLELPANESRCIIGDPQLHPPD